MKQVILPKWLYKEENYEPQRDRDFFISKSILKIVHILFSIKKQGGSGNFSVQFIPGKILLTLVVLVLTASARNSAFLLCVLAGELIVLCRLSAEKLLVILRAALAAGGVSLLILLPSLWLGQERALLLIVSKTILTVMTMSLLVTTTAWHSLTGSLRFFRVPQLLIFIFDLTLKYIVLLGEICLQMLYAVKLRSVGKNRQKKRVFAGIFGVTFLKSREMSEEMYQAMCCRGFTGEYRVDNHIKWRRHDFLYAVLAIFLLILYIHIEGVL